MNTHQKKILELLKNGTGVFDYIINNAHDMAKSDMIDIIRELDYGIYKSIDKAETYNIAADELSERWCEEE